MEDDTEIKTDDVFTHLESGNRIVVTCVGSMKAEGQDWMDAVTYRNVDGTNPNRQFTRSMVAFKHLFVRGAKEA